MTKHHTKKSLKKKQESIMTDRRQIQREGKNKQTGKKALPFLTSRQNKKKYVRFDIIFKKLKKKEKNKRKLKQQNDEHHCETSNTQKQGTLQAKL